LPTSGKIVIATTAQFDVMTCQIMGKLHDFKDFDERGHLPYVIHQ